MTEIKDIAINGAVKTIENLDINGEVYKLIGKAEPKIEPLTIVENGIYNATTIDGYNPITVDCPTPKIEQEKTIEIKENGVIVVTPDINKVLSKVVANINIPIQAERNNIATGTITVTSEGMNLQNFIFEHNLGANPTQFYMIASESSKPLYSDLANPEKHCVAGMAVNNAYIIIVDGKERTKLYTCKKDSMTMNSLFEFTDSNSMLYKDIFLNLIPEVTYRWFAIIE